MRSFHALTLILVTVFLTAAVSRAAAQKTGSATVPSYDPASEATFKGIVTDVFERQCPMSGGVGSHLNLKLEDSKTIEVHLAATRFLKSFDVAFSKGDKVEVVGVKVQFEGKETIFARGVTPGSETFTFRSKDGRPIW